MTADASNIYRQTADVSGYVLPAPRPAVEPVFYRHRYIRDDGSKSPWLAGKPSPFQDEPSEVEPLVPAAIAHQALAERDEARAQKRPWSDKLAGQTIDEQVKTIDHLHGKLTAEKARADALAEQVKTLREAGNNACDLLERFIDTFGGLEEGYDSRADLNDYRQALTSTTPPASEPDQSAIRKQAFEEAAKIAEAMTDYSDNLQRSVGALPCGERIATAIREAAR